MVLSKITPVFDFIETNVHWQEMEKHTSQPADKTKSQDVKVLRGKMCKEKKEWHVPTLSFTHPTVDMFYLCFPWSVFLISGSLMFLTLKKNKNTAGTVARVLAAEIKNWTENLRSNWYLWFPCLLVSCMWECDTFFSPCQLQFPRLGLWTEEEWWGLNKASFSFSHPYLFTGRSLQGHASSRSSDSEVEKFFHSSYNQIYPQGGLSHVHL